MTRYVFKDDEPIRIKAAGKADPQVIGNALEKIAAGNDGRLTPTAVVEAARDKASPLHIHFEWDDKLAAEAFRLDQARNIVRIVRVDDDAHPSQPRAFLSVAAKDGVAYRQLSEIERSSDLQLALINQAERDLSAFQSRYREMADICEIVTTARTKLAEKRSKMEQRKAA